MVVQTTDNTITFSKKAIRKIGGMVILPLREYKKLCERAVPIYQLRGKEAEDVDKLVEEGLREYKAGKCKIIKSLADLD